MDSLEHHKPAALSAGDSARAARRSLRGAALARRSLCGVGVGVGRRSLRGVVRDLPPAYFALVMATGIVSIASHLMGFPLIAEALFRLNLAAFAVLCLLNAARIAAFPQAALADLRSHAVSPGYFTVVAAISVLGVQLVALGCAAGVAAWLWLVALALLALIVCTVFTLLITAPRKPTLGRGLNGLWLIAVVATQSIAALGALVATEFGQYRELVLLAALLFFLMGGALYLLLMPIIFFRLVFVPLQPEEMTPPYWISMGATAITTQAGAALILHIDPAGALAGMLPFLRGFTLFFWATGTSWIPLLAALTIWAHGVRGAPLRYSPAFWGMVFPLGMYTACTSQLADATGFAILRVIPEHTIYVAQAAWALTFAALARRILRGMATLGAVARLFGGGS